MGIDVLTYITTQFHDIFYTGLENIKPYSLGLLSVLIVIDGGFFFISTMFRGGLTEGFMSKVLTYGTYIFIISEFSRLIQTIMKSFFFIGAMVGGNLIDESYVTSPSLLVKRGMDLCMPTFEQLIGAGKAGVDGGMEIAGNSSSGIFSLILNAINGVTLSVIGSYVFFFLTILLCFLCFALLALQITLTVCEFYVCGLVAYVMIPFGVFKPFAFMAEKAFGSIVMFGTKLICMGIVASVAERTFQGWSGGKVLDFQGAFFLLLMAGTLMVLTWVIPAVVSAAHGGSPALSGSGLVGSAISTATTAYTSLQMAKTIFSKTGGSAASGGGSGTSGGPQTIQPQNNASSSSGSTSAPQSILRPKK